MLAMIQPARTLAKIRTMLLETSVIGRLVGSGCTKLTIGIIAHGLRPLVAGLAIVGIILL